MIKGLKLVGIILQRKEKKALYFTPSPLFHFVKGHFAIVTAASAQMDFLFSFFFVCLMFLTGWEITELVISDKREERLDSRR